MRQVRIKKIKIKAKVWLWPGETAAWHFVSVPKLESSKIKEKFGKGRRGFGSIPVAVKLGKTTWRTSIFPDAKSGQYLLPIKASVRQAEGIFADDTVLLILTVVP